MLELHLPIYEFALENVIMSMVQFSTIRSKNVGYFYQITDVSVLSHAFPGLYVPSDLYDCTVSVGTSPCG